MSTTQATLPPLPGINFPAPRVSVGTDRQMPVTDDKSKSNTNLPVSETQNMKKIAEINTKQQVSVMGSLEDAREALVGIPADFLAQRGTVYEIITRQNRLRGLGVILILIALAITVSGILHPCAC